MTRPALSSDCSSCFGLCCVLTPFQAISGFGVDKPSGVPCLNLADDDGCRIHATLREDGWPRCTVFECFGAGQQVSQVTYGGQSWRESDNLGEMAAVLSVMRQLHEMLAHLDEVDRRSPDAGAAAITDEIETLVGKDPATLLAVDVEGLHDRVGALLRSASQRVRRHRPHAVDHARADLAGADLRSTDLRGAGLRGALLIRADLRDVDLTDTDLLGADLRDADVRGARLDGALFLTQPQVNAARGDGRTRLAGRLDRPGHWGPLRG